MGRAGTENRLWLLTGFRGPFLWGAALEAGVACGSGASHPRSWAFRPLFCLQPSYSMQETISPRDILFLHSLAEMGRGSPVCLAKISTVQMIFSYLIGFDRSEVRKQSARWAATSEACIFGRRQERRKRKLIPYSLSSRSDTEPAKGPWSRQPRRAS